MPRLSSRILRALIEKTHKSEQTIRNGISDLGKKFPQATINARAQLLAQQHETSVIRMLSKEDRATLPSVEIEKPRLLKAKQKGNRTKTRLAFNYETTNKFLADHFTEINKAYDSHCYTCVFILCRKVLENMLCDIIQKKYFENKKKQTFLYFDPSRGRSLDLSKLIINLYSVSHEFKTEKGLLERILARTKEFKEDADAKTHSLYHIVKSKKEIDEKHFQDILNMIAELEQKIAQ